VTRRQLRSAFTVSRIVATVGITDRDRKILWSRAHGLCALCHAPLVEDATEADREAVIGEEAHIVSRSPSGPRGGQIDQALVDAYDNLILLCPTHHTLIDSQPEAWPVARLRQLKAKHEAWAKCKLVDDGRPRLVAHPDDPDLPGGNPLWRVTSGAQLWDIVATSDRYWLAGLDDEDTDDPELVDLADSFLQNLRDYGEIAGDLEGNLMQVRDCKRSLGALLAELESRGMLVFGVRRRRILKGGVGPETEWGDAHVAVVLRSDPSIRPSPLVQASDAASHERGARSEAE
jgi:hypothetical protein